MYLITNIENESNPRRLCIHLGNGLVGNAILRQLLKHGNVLVHKRVDWSNIALTIRWIADCELAQGQYDCIDIVWATGKAKFSDPREVTQKEEQDFESILRTLNQKFSPLCKQIRLWLMSSAGGLFEGQTHVDFESKITCKRPYSKLKRYQEESASQILPTVICRVSSVYTTKNLSGRMGLIPTLLQNDFHSQVCTITGNPSTLRDYVLDEDVGRFVCNGIVLGTEITGVQYLIDGRSVSIQTIINTIEGITNRKLFVKYSRNNRNDANMSFSPRLRAKSFRSGSLTSNIRILHQNIRSNRITI